MKKSVILEACVGSFTEALIAEKLGANRVELCDNLAEGGTTPSYGTIKVSKQILGIPVWVILRPRGGDFVYNEHELEIMRNDVKICKELNADGIVLGFLTMKGTIDLDLLKEFTELAKPLKIAFHMAFDEVEDKKEALEFLVKSGVVRILTKGGKGKAHDNKETLKELVTLGEGRIVVMPGGGVTNENCEELREYCGCTEMHGRKIVGSLDKN